MSDAQIKLIIFVTSAVISAAVVFGVARVFFKLGVQRGYLHGAADVYSLWTGRRDWREFRDRFKKGTS